MHRLPDPHALGQIYTLPISEIQAFHSLSEELVKSLEQRAEAAAMGRSTSTEPFGFAAFTSLAAEAETQSTPEA